MNSLDHLDSFDELMHQVNPNQKQTGKADLQRKNLQRKASDLSSDDDISYNFNEDLDVPLEINQLKPNDSQLNCSHSKLNPNLKKKLQISIQNLNIQVNIHGNDGKITSGRYHSRRSHYKTNTEKSDKNYIIEENYMDILVMNPTQFYTQRPS